MRHRRPPTLIDWLLAVVVALFAVTEEVSQRLGPSPESVLLWVAAGVVGALGVLFRRRAPLAILIVYSAVNGVLVTLVRDAITAWQLYTQLVLLFTLLSEVPHRSVKTAVGLVVTGAYMFVLVALTNPPIVWSDLAVLSVMTLMAAGSGIAVRRHRVLAVLAAERGELLAREAVSEERARIARELHDIVAHSVSVMTMQSGGVRLRLGEDQESERQLLTSVEETGREALTELRRAVGLLRGPEGGGPAPRAGLDRLPDLLEQVRAAGLEVTLDVRGEPVPLPAGLDLSAYRIVQEALTNALKHAGPTRATVTIVYHPGELRLEIVDQGPRNRSSQQGPAGESGHGLIGMRERAALFHGTLTAGPLPSGGFAVRVVLPL
ncbi:sensor histidine kinase [Nonomuraea sp. 10N515B]|uniref:sensor histidine kinase n=1 Tax=Nonomuraea sp. 10N515B TaxID=3457422 RepID=UPI003FCDCFF3